MDQLTYFKVRNSTLKVLKNRLELASIIAIGAAILNAGLLPEVVLIGSGASRYWLIVFPMVLAYPVSLMSAGLSKKWSMKSIFYIAIVCTFVLAIAVSWIEVINVKLDHQEPVFREVTITFKKVTGRSHRPFRVFFRMPNSESIGELPVSREMYESIQIGDLLSLKIGDGYLGMPWLKGDAVTVDLKGATDLRRKVHR